MLIDSHCHLPHKNYKKSVEDILKEAQENNISKCITIGTSLKENSIVEKISNTFDNVYFTVAIYPHEELHSDMDTVLSELETKFLLNKNPKLVGLGECGIDITNWSGGRSIEDQLYLFEKQIQLSIKYDLPLIIHNRNGDSYVLGLLNKYVPLGLRGVIHCFDSDWTFAKKILDLNFYISFSGLITYNKKDTLLEVVKNIPLDKFLVETDSPYLAPQKYRGEVNSPKYVRIIAEKVAEVKQIDISIIENNSYQNTSKLFRI